METIFLGIHCSYKDVHVGLFKNDQMIAVEVIANAQASKQLVFIIDHIFEKHAVSLSSLSFIFVNQGPAPFTTLRTVLTTVNALHVACGIPLIGVDSLKTLADEWGESDFRYTITLLDAFNNDVYFCFKDQNNAYQTGYENITIFISRVAQMSVEQITFIGNGAALHQSAIQNALADRGIFPAHVPLTASLPYMARKALDAWHHQKAQSKLLPLYLKLHPAQAV
jgi:tRNA threonylcarbamoyl adenosine modification protein YeaZ